MEHAPLVLGSLVFFAAGIVTGISTFGFSLIAVPLLTLFMPVKDAVLTSLLLSMVPRVLLLIETYTYIQIRKYIPLILFGIAGTFLGSQILLFVDPSVLKKLVGLVTTLAAVAFLANFKRPIANEQRAFPPVGLLSGVLHGSVGMGGPPVVLFLSNQNTKKKAFRATLTLFYGILSVSGIVLPLYSGALHKDIILSSLWYIPMLLGGTWLGIRLAGSVPDTTFRKIVLVVILISGIAAVVL